MMLLGAIAIIGVADPTRYAVVDAEALLGFPQIALNDQPQEEQPLFAVLLPGTDRVLIMRPITEGEYGSFQVQAISYQIIEQEMLATAIVMPIVNPSDVAAFPSDLVVFLQQQVNAISGFDVFNVISPDDS